MNIQRCAPSQTNGPKFLKFYMNVCLLHVARIVVKLIFIFYEIKLHKISTHIFWKKQTKPEESLLIHS